MDIEREPVFIGGAVFVLLAALWGLVLLEPALEKLRAQWRLWRARRKALEGKGEK